MEDLSFAVFDIFLIFIFLSMRDFNMLKNLNAEAKIKNPANPVH